MVHSLLAPAMNIEADNMRLGALAVTLARPFGESAAVGYTLPHRLRGRSRSGLERAVSVSRIEGGVHEPVVAFSFCEGRGFL